MNFDFRCGEVPGGNGIKVLACKSVLAVQQEVCDLVRFLLGNFRYKVDGGLVIGDADALETWYAVLGWGKHPGCNVIGGVGKNSFGDPLKGFEDWFNVGHGRVDGVFTGCIGVVTSS